MGFLRGLTALLVGILLLTACGEVDDLSAEVDTAAGQASDITLPPPLDTIEGVDLSRVLLAGCAG